MRNFNATSIVNSLKNRGYEAQVVTVTKNGIDQVGISFMVNGNVGVTLYPEKFRSETESELIEELINVYEHHKNDAPDFDVTQLMDWEYIRENCFLCVQRKTEEDIVKRNFLDLEQYVRVKVNVSGTRASYKVKRDMLEAMDITESQLFNAAVDNTKQNVSKESVLSFMARQMGMSTEELHMLGAMPDMTILTNKAKHYGAASICFNDVLKEIADEYGTDLAIIPSSIHECLLHPVEDSTDFRLFDSTICEVNDSEIEPEEVLGTHAYRYVRDEGRIVY